MKGEKFLKETFKAKARESRGELLENIERLVKIKSVENLNEEGTHFGKGPKMALEEALAIAREMGN